MSKLTLKLTQHLHRAARRPVLKDDVTHRWYSGGELAADVDQLKDQLRGLHVGHGDVVLVALPNTVVYPVLIQAAWELGAVIFPVASTITPAGLRALLRQRTVAAWVVAPELLAATVTTLSTVTRLRLNTTAALTLVRDATVPGHVAATPTEADEALILRQPGAQQALRLTYAALRTAAVATERPGGTQLPVSLATPLAYREAQVTLVAARLRDDRVVLLTRADRDGGQAPVATAVGLEPQPSRPGVVWSAVHYRQPAAVRGNRRFANPAKSSMMEARAPTIP